MPIAHYAEWLRVASLALPNNNAVTGHLETSQPGSNQNRPL